MNELSSRFPDPRHSPGLMLWHVTNAWQRAIRAALAPHDLTHVQFVLLATLTSMQPAQVTQRQLAEAASTDTMMTSQVIRAMETKGFVRRTQHSGDKRAFLLLPTPVGASLVNEAIASVEAVDAKFFGALPSDQLESFVASLNSLAGPTARAQ